MKQTTLEICANSVQSAKFAALSGATRIELCSNLEQGGTTPSAGMILEVNKLEIEVYVLIRPRIGDFLYNENEYETIKLDVLFCKENDCEGIVIGFLTNEGKIDITRTREIVALAKPMKVTFHRAFDCVANASEALEDVISTGCTRILTSGLSPKAIEGKVVLQQLVKASGNRISIMAGSGVNVDNVAELYSVGIREFHASASVNVVSKIASETEVAKDFYIPYKETELKKVEQLVKQLEALSDGK